MNWSGKRIIVACLLTAALGLMLCPPWHGQGHRLLWNGRGSLDWSRLALELCLVAIIGALAAVVVPMVGRPSTRALEVWFRRAGVVLGCAAVLILAATAGHDGIARFALLRDYNQKVQEFPSQRAATTGSVSSGPRPTRSARIPTLCHPFPTIHEAEIMLRSLGCDDRNISTRWREFLSTSRPSTTLRL